MAVDETCPVCRTAEIVCGKWTLLLVRDLAEGRSRFCELERSLAGISPRTLSLRLRALEEEGIVERHTFPEVPPRVEYALTEKGRALLPIIDDMRAYGEDWLGADGAPTRRPRPAPTRWRWRSCLHAALQERAAPSRSARAGREVSARCVTTARDGARGVPRGRRRRPARRVAAGAEVPFELGASGARGGARPVALLLPPADRPVHRRARRARSNACPATPAATLLERFDGLDRYLASVGGDAAHAPSGRSARARRDRRCSASVRRADRLRAAPRAPAGDAERLQQLDASRAPARSRSWRRCTALTIASAELPLATGLTIAQPEALDGVPAEAAGAGRRRAARAPPGRRLATEQDDAPRRCDAGARCLRDLLRALRLFGDGRVTLGPLAWARIGGGAVERRCALGAGGRPHGMLVVTAEQEDELRAFCNLVSRRAPHGNELAWALRRFELGCERASPSRR